MAITLNTNIKNDTDGYLLDAKNVKGGYLSVDTLANLQSFSLGTKEAGSFAYVRENSKFYIYNGTSWQEVKFYDDTAIKDIIPADANVNNKLTDKNYVTQFVSEKMSQVSSGTAIYSYDTMFAVFAQYVYDKLIIEFGESTINENISAVKRNIYIKTSRPTGEETRISLGDVLNNAGLDINNIMGIVNHKYVDEQIKAIEGPFQMVIASGWAYINDGDIDIVEMFENHGITEVYHSSQYLKLKSANIGDNIYFISPNVPDLWITKKDDNAIFYGSLDSKVDLSNIESSVSSINTEINSVKSALDLKADKKDISGKLDKSGGTINAGGTKTPLILKGGANNHREGLRIIPSNGWSTIVLGGNDIGESQGTSANSWSILNNNGSFFISKNGDSGAAVKLSNTDGTWKVNNNTIIHSGNIGSQSVNYATTAGSAIRSDYFNSVASVAGGHTPQYPWRRIISMGPTTNNYEDRVGTYYLSGNYHEGPWYLFRVEFRTHTSSNGDVGSFKIAVIATNSEVSNLAIASYSVATNGVTTSYADVFVKVGAYPRMLLTRLSASDNGIIKYYNSNEGDNGSSRTEAYKDINGSGAGYASYDLHARSSYPVVTNGVLTATVWRSNSVKDISNNNATTFAYSKDGLGYDNFTWLAAWNGYELRAVDKSQFARASHTHSQYYNTSDLGNTTFKVTRSASQSTATTGYWAAMVRSDQTGSPVLPSKAKWWHVISMDWTGTDYNNWFSQLALPTQDGGVPHYRRNNSGGTTIDSSTWHSFITDENIGSQSVNKANLISPHQNVTTTEKSTWDPTNSGKIIWGQRFINSSISSDSGDLTLFLRGANGETELCMNIDGDYYSNGNKIARADHTHDKINTAFVFNNSDLPEGAANLGLTTSAHKMTFYRNGISIPYQMDNANDGGILRCRGNSESNTIVELGTWDDSGAGETIQFNYYSTSSQATPAHSVSVPKKSGTIALTSDIPGIATSSAAGLVKSSTTGKTTNRDYNVQVNSDGTMKVNVPWTDHYAWSDITSKPSLVKSVTIGLTQELECNMEGTVQSITHTANQEVVFDGLSDSSGEEGKVLDMSIRRTSDTNTNVYIKMQSANDGIIERRAYIYYHIVTYNY